MKGQIVTVPFPFADLVNTKVRPALILEEWNSVVFSTPIQGAVVCQITSQDYHKNAIEIDLKDVLGGGLHKKSYVVPSMIFTVTKSSIIKKVGKLTPEKHQEVIDKVIETITPK